MLEIDYFGGSNPILNFTVHTKDGKERDLVLEVKYCIHGGIMTKVVNQNIKNFRAAFKSYGYYKPREYPAPRAHAYLVPSFNATVSQRIQVYDNATFAEVEPCFLIDEKGNIYVTVSTDHPDMNMNFEIGLRKSRLYAPRVLCRDVWLYEDIKDHWDQLNLRCYGYPQGKRTLWEDNILGDTIDAETRLEIRIAEKFPL